MELINESIVPKIIGQRALFDYSALDQETQIAIRLRTSEIKSLAKRMAADVVEIGGKLAEVKEHLGSNGRFNEWLATELAWSERTAYNFIAVWQKFGAANFALENVATSALYLLAAPSTPAEAVQAAKQIADSGEKVTHEVAKELTRQAKARKPKQVALVEEPEEEGDEETRGQGDRETREDVAPASSAALDAEPAAAAMGARSVAIPARPSEAAAQLQRPAAWYKSRIEISITLMPCDGPEADRKILHSARAGDDTPFVQLEKGEMEILRNLPSATKELLRKLNGALAKKPALKASAKPKAVSKPAAKKPSKPAPKAAAKQKTAKARK